MNQPESLRKSLNKRQTELRGVMMAFDQHEAAMQMFLEQHANVQTFHLHMLQYFRSILG